MSLELCDELEGGFGWTEHGFLERTSHALEVGGRVLVFDPIDAPGLDGALVALGEPDAVVQLLDRHSRDCASVAARLGVLHLRMELGGREVGQLLPVRRSRWWTEVAFWEPSRRVLVVGDALGSAGYFLAPGERIAVHPLLRLRPPASLRAVARCQAPRHVLFGHGAGIHGEDAALALETALNTARRRLPRLVAGQLRRKR
jgi:hypothetical protein